MSRKRGLFEERRLLVETLFKRVDAQDDRVAAYEFTPEFQELWLGIYAE